MLEGLGFSPYDALHLALSESSKADLFLTTDDKLQKLVNKNAERVLIEVKNPLNWVLEAAPQ